MVAEQSRLAVALVLNGSGRELEVLEVSHQAIGEKDPELALDELGEFFAQEVGVVVGGFVASPLEASVLEFVGPGLVRGEDRDTVVAPLAQQRSSWVLDPVELGGEVGASAKFIDEGLPGVGSKKLGGQVTN